MIFPTISKTAVVQFALVSFITTYAPQAMEAPDTNDKYVYHSHAPKRSIAMTPTDDSDSDISGGETSESEQESQPEKKRLKKEKNKERPKSSIHAFRGLPEGYTQLSLVSSSSIQEMKDESDEENTEENVYHYTAPPLPILTHVINIGTKLKLLANVYLGKIDHLANIFFPQYVLEVEQKDKTIRKTTPSFFVTHKEEVCVFASGGTQNAWEKTVAKVYEIFFGQKVKIIRARWMQKHLKLNKRLTEEFKVSENELHSEFYYDLFFEHFFLPFLKDVYHGSIKKLTINAFSWWEICDSCNDNYLVKHKKLCSQQGIEGPIFNIAAARRYNHHYPPATTFMGYRVPLTQEKGAWNEIWNKLKTYVDEYLEDTDEKREFWTKTVEGLELCKWLGQAFVENMHSLEGRTVTPHKRGDILKFYSEMTKENTEELQNLIRYLCEENWDLSCWYKYPYLKRIQGNWKQHALQIVMPHFGWKFLSGFEVEYGEGQCEMCGNEGVRYMSMVYHSKHQVTKKLLELTEEEEKRDWGYTLQTPFKDLSESMKKKRRQSLAVGSECVKFLLLNRKEVDDWKKGHPEAERKAKLQNLQKRQEYNEAVDITEANELYKWMRSQSSHGNRPLPRRDILQNSEWDVAKELNALIKILLQRNKIQEIKEGRSVSYLIKENRVEGGADPKPNSHNKPLQKEQNQKSSKSSSSDEEVTIICLD